jgi:hypothetical protein
MLGSEGKNPCHSREYDVKSGIFLASMSASAEICCKVLTHD